jgi:hypothetical protein
MIVRERIAKRAFLSFAEGKPVLNLQFDELGIARGEALERIEILPEQLGNICADGVKALWGETQ